MRFPWALLVLPPFGRTLRRFVKLSEDITETLEVVPRQWKLIQTVREKFSCRNRERISQLPASFHLTPRG